MALDTINLPDESGMQGCNGKCKRTERIQNLCPLLPLLWLNAFSLSNQILNSELLLVCPTMCGRSHRGSNLRHRYSQEWISTCHPKCFGTVHFP